MMYKFLICSQLSLINSYYVDFESGFFNINIFVDDWSFIFLDILGSGVFSIWFYLFVLVVFLFDFMVIKFLNVII